MNRAEAAKLLIDQVVKQTGYPAIGQVLQAEGIADRRLLRDMERKGIIKRIPVKHAGTVFYGYYSNDEVPKIIRERSDEHAGVREDGEGREAVGESEGDRQEAVRENGG